jgi:MFS family permease
MWSIFNKPLMAQFGYSASEVSLVYSLFMFMSLVGSIIAGWLQNRMESRRIGSNGPRVSV